VYPDSQVTFSQIDGHDSTFAHYYLTKENTVLLKYGQLMMKQLIAAITIND